jgi:hypothetical protein
VTESIGVKGVRAARRSRLRVAVAAATVAASILVAVFALEALSGLRTAFVRALFSFADTQFSEGPLILQLHRMATGDALYRSTLEVNSYVIGPVYLLVLGAFGFVSGHHVDVVSSRFLTMFLGLLGLVPLVFSTLVVARRTGVRASNVAATAVAGTAAAALGAAVLARTMTFDTLHPDDLSFTLVAASLAIYYAVASGLAGARYAWLLPGAGLLAAFTDLHAVAVVPMLLFCLAVTRSISVRLLSATLATYVGLLVLFLAIMNPAARAWSLLIPLAQPGEFTTARFAEAFTLVTRWQPYIGLLVVSVPVAISLIRRREGARTLWVDAVVFAVIVATAGAGFFHRLGVKNSLFLISIFCLPYFCATLGALTTPRVLAFRGNALRAASALGAALSVAMIFALAVPPKQVAGAEVYAAMESASALAADTCNRGRDVVVLALPDLFFGCPKAAYALGASFEQLAAAFPDYYIGQTAFDKRLDAEYVVTVDSAPLPHAWAADFRLARKVPAFVGFDEHYFPASIQVFRHR